MKYLDTTAGSTHATNIAITTYMPPAQASTVLAICNSEQAGQAEVARLEAEVARLEAEVRHLTPDDAHARAVRSGRLEALIVEVLKNATLHARVMEETNLNRRVDIVIAHLRENKDHYRIKKPPCEETVYKYLVKHGYTPSVARVI